MMDGQSVLVTEFVAGERAPGRARTYAILGALLGRPHARPATTVRAGGAWHHLCPQGGPADEIASVRVLLDEFGLAADHRLRSTVEQMDDAADLPHAFVHPDFVPANAIATGDDQLVMRQGYKKPAQVLVELERDRTLANEIADRAIRALTTPPDR
jgi:hypothetical protein